MTTNFDYRNCTVEELADYVQISTSSRITQQLIYYQRKEDAFMVDKIKEARKIARKRKLLLMLEGM